MALLFIDSFDHYATADILTKWTSNGTGGSLTVGSSSGRFNNGAGSGGNRGQIKGLATSYSTLIMGCAIRITSYGSGTAAVFHFRDSGTDKTDLRLNTSGQLIVTRSGTQIGSIGTTVLSLNIWYYIEFKVTFATDATGAYEVLINGITELSGSSIQTVTSGTTTANQIEIRSGAGGNTQGVDFDDLYVCDTSGGVNDDFLGDVRIEALFPNGNGNSSVLVGSDGNSTDNYLLVDETTPNDADYVESSTPGDKDTYTYTNLTPSSGTVYGVQPIPRAAKTDAGTRSIVSVARLSGTETDGSVKTLSTSVTYYPDIRETKPGGGSWAISDVNSSEFGVKINA